MKDKIKNIIIVSLLILIGILVTLLIRQEMTFKSKSLECLQYPENFRIDTTYINQSNGRKVMIINIKRKEKE